MNRTLLIATLITLPAVAHANPLEEMASDAQLKDWATCLMNYRYALRTGATDASKAGDTTAGQLAATCLAQAKADPKKDDVWTDKLRLYVGSFRGDIARLEKGEDSSYDTVHGQAETCSDVVMYAMQIMDPATQVDLPGSEVPPWKGPLSDAHEICEQGTKAADAIKAKLLGPFMKAGIKADKLDTISEHITTYFQIPGGETTQDPKKLAAASVWFLEFDGGACAAGEVTSLERFQFDKAQKLVKTSSKDYCGTVPKSAYR